MMLIKNRLIFGIIRSSLFQVVKIVYFVLRLFNLQAVLLVGLVGLVLYFTGALTSNETLFIIYMAVLVLTTVLSIVFGIRKLFKKLKPKKSRGVDIMPSASAHNTEIVTGGGMQSVNAQPKTQQVLVEERTYVTERPLQPKYYAVKGHAGYYMAEYLDRVELYKKTGSGLVKIRTDYKK